MTANYSLAADLISQERIRQIEEEPASTILPVRIESLVKAAAYIAQELDELLIASANNLTGDPDAEYNSPTRYSPFKLRMARCRALEDAVAEGKLDLQGGNNFPQPAMSDDQLRVQVLKIVRIIEASDDHTQ